MNTKRLFFFRYIYLPSFITRRHELCWKYQLPKGKHHVKLKIRIPSKSFEIVPGDVIIYSDKMLDGTMVNFGKAKSLSK